MTRFKYNPWNLLMFVYFRRNLQIQVLRRHLIVGVLRRLFPKLSVNCCFQYIYDNKTGNTSSDTVTDWQRPWTRNSLGCDRMGAQLPIDVDVRSVSNRATTAMARQNVYPTASICDTIPV